MVRNKFKWKFAFFLYLILVSVFTKSLPIRSSGPLITVTDNPLSDLILDSSTNSFQELKIVDILEESNDVANETKSEQDLLQEPEDVSKGTKSETNSTEVARNNLLRQLRPGQVIRQYNIEITYQGDTFGGRAMLDVRVEQATREDPIVLRLEDLDVNSVLVGISATGNLSPVDYDIDDGIIEIFPEIFSNIYIVIIEYTGQILSDGFFQGGFGNVQYAAMNLHPTHARRVFPCIDEPTEPSTVSFTFNDFPFTNIVATSMLEENSQNQFRALMGPLHQWGMVAHNFININIPVANVLLFGRSGLTSQDAFALTAINYYFNSLNEWTDKSFFEIVLNQDGRMVLLAIPDSDKEWVSLSTVCVWEPHILMENIHSVKQRKTAMVKIAEAMASPWFGYVIYPENWRYEWVVSGLKTYASYEIIREFQNSGVGNDITLLDINTLFVTDIIQESLYRDAYANSQPLEPGDDLAEEQFIRDHINGLLKYKAPALLWMLKQVLGGDEDIVQIGARDLLSAWALEPITSSMFYDSLNSEWMNSGGPLIEDIEEYLEPWVLTNGYPLIHVGLRQGGVIVTQERFGFSDRDQLNYGVPITYTTSINPDYENIEPIRMMDSTTTFNMVLDEEDYVIFNIQGQGYYRVNYDFDLWERIIEALIDPDRRQEIHPLNRATMVDDALNLARAGKLDYETAFMVVLSMEHETEYAVWKAFVRNMDFLRKRLVSHVTEDEDLDPDIYLRMVRRTIGTFENEIGFYPDISLSEPAMVTLTRGLVMDHACRANYQPCIAAAIDWFYNPNSNEPEVNPNIPYEIRPAVYCTMVREGDNDVIAALYARLDVEPTLYERLVILESLACSRDESFINTLLQETIADNGPYTTEERVKIFAAVVEASYENARLALNFIALRTNEIRNMYGGPGKLEELIFILAENMPNPDLSNDFMIWINSMNSNLDESFDVAERARDQVSENILWDASHLEYVYEWIDENDAPTLMVSLFLLCASLLLTMSNL